MKAAMPPVPRILLLVITLACLNVACPRPTCAQAELDQQQVYRFDPIAGQLVATPAEQQRVGFVYRCFRPDLDRWVWTLYEGDGQFSFALGEGTMQPAQRLDHKLEVGDASGAARRINPTLSEAIRERSGRVFVRLNGRDQWEVHGPFGLPTAFDLETGRRWESHGGQYVPVSHTTGYRWRVDGGRYVPAGSSYSVSCGCGGSTFAGH